VDQLLDVRLNYRQSTLPGGSRSEGHALLVTLFSGVMRRDIRHPAKRFSDLFVLMGGHTIPLIYTTLALFNEALRGKCQQTKDPRYLAPNAEERALLWQDLLHFRHRGGGAGRRRLSVPVPRASRCLASRAKPDSRRARRTR
jgi:transketolase